MTYKKSELRKVLPSNLFDNSRNKKGEGHKFRRSVALHLPDSLDDELKDIAKVIGCSKAKLLRFALSDFVERLKDEKSSDLQNT